MEKNRPRVGIGVIIIRGNRILLGKRLNSHGSGDWCFPGGHLEFWESFGCCAARETEEETGLKLSNISFVTATNDIFEHEGKHYITIFMRASADEGEPELKEPGKCMEWRWFSKEDMPDNLFLPIRNLLKSGYDPFSA